MAVLLVLAMAMLGAINGVLYAALRGAISARLRLPLWTVFTACGTWHSASPRWSGSARSSLRRLGLDGLVGRAARLAVPAGLTVGTLVAALELCSESARIFG